MGGGGVAIGGSRSVLVRALNVLRETGTAEAAVEVQRLVSAYLSSPCERAPHHLRLPDIDYSDSPTLRQAAATAAVADAATLRQPRRFFAGGGEYDASLVDAYKGRLRVTLTAGPAAIEVLPKQEWSIECSIEVL